MLRSKKGVAARGDIIYNMFVSMIAHTVGKMRGGVLKQSGESGRKSASPGKDAERHR